MRIQAALLSCAILGAAAMCSFSAIAGPPATLGVTATVLPTKLQRTLRLNVVFVDAQGKTQTLTRKEKALFALHPAELVNTLKSDGAPLVVSVLY